MSVGTNIKKRRYELGMSQQDLANALGYKTRSTIAKIESGENDISQKKLARFAQVLDTTAEALVSGNHRGYFAFRAGPSADSAQPAEQPGEHGRRGRNAAVILAGGKSARNQQNIPNQFISILGKPVIAYCLEAYQSHPAIDDIYVVCLKGWEQIVTAYAEEYRITKLRGLIPSAASGILSVQNGFDFIKEKYTADDVIIFQESTRPMVSVEMISKLLQSCQEYGSANICQTMRDFIQFSCADGQQKYVDRNSAVDVQSPEAYRFAVLEDIFKTAKQQHYPLTQSCCVMLMHELGYHINFVEGSVNNIKIVRQEDVALFTALITNR